MSEVLRPILEAARAGDRQALNELASCVDRFVRAFSGTLSRHLRRTYGSTVDFVLEGLAEALAHLEDFEYHNDEQFYAWVSKFIRHRIIDTARRERRKKRADRPLALRDESEEIQAPGATPSGIVSHQEVRNVLGRALLELQVEYPQEMEVVLLKVFEGQSWEAIANWLDLSSEKRARTLFARGLDLLRPKVAESLGKATFQEFLGL